MAVSNEYVTGMAQTRAHPERVPSPTLAVVALTTYAVAFLALGAWRASRGPG